MGRSGRRILGDTDLGAEDPIGVVEAVAPGRRVVHDPCRGLVELGHVGLECAQLVLRRKLPHLDQRVVGRRGREVELDPVAVGLGAEDATPRVEMDALTLLRVTVLPEHVGTGEGGMTADVDLNGRREPTQVPVAVATSNEKRRL